MSYKDCLACRNAKIKPREIVPTRVVFDPAIGRNGWPTIDGSSLSAPWLAPIVLSQGIDYVVNDCYPHLRREEVITACWWMGRFGPRKWRKLWGEWAAEAEEHLWYRCGAIPDPPQ